MNLQMPLSLETVHADGTESEAREESEAIEESDASNASKALVATSCPAVLSGFPCLKYHAATQLSIYRAVTGFPRVLNAAPRKGVGCRSVQTHRLSCSPLASIRVACMKNSERVQQKLNASIARRPCASRFRDNSICSYSPRFRSS